MYSNISTDYYEKFLEIIKTFGGVYKDKEKYIPRKNLKADAFTSKGAFFGCVGETEGTAGAYSDLSVVIFPSNEDETANDRWIISLVVGSLGYKNDYQIASLPGTRRTFSKYLPSNSFIKNDFLDIESEDSIGSYLENISDSLRGAVSKYLKLILACSIFDPNNTDDSINLIKKYLAIYADLRHWATNKESRNSIKEALDNAVCESTETDYESEIARILKARKYVVLQGAPGTGKTYTAKKIIKDINPDNVFFTQFHAETSYSDFIYGIFPSTESTNLNYIEKKGPFVKAIERARKVADDSNIVDKDVYLIVDEINRANLANVLGQAFYLFEPTMSESNVDIEICPGLNINKLPENLYVIATMNTADRSLAIVDFALRRRFAWITIRPHTVKADGGYCFCEREFNAIDDIFMKYATDEELNLQPGHAYFIVKQNDKEKLIKDRLKYELMPLIKEYLQDGMLGRAKTDFEGFFRKELKTEMFK